MKNNRLWHLQMVSYFILALMIATFHGFHDCLIFSVVMLLLFSIENIRVELRDIRAELLKQAGRIETPVTATNAV